MTSFFIALFVGCGFSMGARGQALIGQLSDAMKFRHADHGQHPLPLLAIALFCAAASVGLVVAVAGVAAGSSSGFRMMLAIVALVLAALALVWPVKVNPVQEPTRSVVAIGLVLMWRMASDAAWLTLFAVAILVADPLAIGAGGSIGAMLAAWLGWRLGGERMAVIFPPGFRIVLAALTIVAALLIGLNGNYTNL